MDWRTAFSQIPDFLCLDNGHLLPTLPLNEIPELHRFLDYVHIKFCLLKPFMELSTYPVVDVRDLLPSFEPTLIEFSELPAFSMVAFARQLDYFNEIFQFDLLHDSLPTSGPKASAEAQDARILKKNMDCLQRHLPRELRETFQESMPERFVDMTSYAEMINYLGRMDRAHVLSLNRAGRFYLSGIYASLPSDLDTELKRFGLRIRKFKSNDNRIYEQNREFVYQFLMELYGYPISSERRTSAAIFARRLHKMGERFLVKALGQSDRTITSLFSFESGHAYPRVEKVALVHVEARSMEVINLLEREGYFVHPKKRVVILRIVYRQHKFDPNNVRLDRALSVLRQEIIHPLTGDICTSVNLLRDSYSMSLKLNDIVRGEFVGQAVYRANEVVENTETHEKRLKFLHSWLTKHQRRMIGYSEEFYAEITHVLEDYLCDPDMADEFAEMHDLYQSVCCLHAYINQARKVKQLEDLRTRVYRGKRITYRTMLSLTAALLGELKFELATYFETLINQAIYFTESMLNDHYLVKTYITPHDEELTENGRQIKKLYGRLVSLVDEIKAFRKAKTEI